MTEHALRLPRKVVNNRIPVSPEDARALYQLLPDGRLFA